jgi:hypothetical protein
MEPYKQKSNRKIRQQEYLEAEMYGNINMQRIKAKNI